MSANRCQSQEMELLLQRMRALQLRLGSVDPVTQQAAAERVLDWRACAGEAKAREARRARLHKAVTAGAGEAAEEFGQHFDAEYIPRFEGALTDLVPVMEGHSKELADARLTQWEEEFGSRLTALERRSASASTQLEELREACANGYVRFEEANARLDRVWDAQVNLKDSPADMREAIQRVIVERDVEPRPAMEAFREEAFEEDLSGWSHAGPRCPACHEPRGHRKSKTGILDDLLGLVNLVPYQCKRCLHKFYRWNARRK